MRWVLLFAAFVALCGCEPEEEKKAQPQDKPAEVKEVKPAPGEKVRPMVAAGRFYEKDTVKLRKEVEGYISAASIVDEEKKTFSGDAVALIAPHAGFVFSGPVAGYSYAAVKGKSFDTVVVVGSHIPGEGASVLNLDYYQTPLGYVKVDSEVVKKLLAKPHFGFVPNRHNEHAIEVQVPFLQVALKGNFKIVAIAVTDTDSKLIKTLAADLAEALKGRKVLLVGSTDLTHYPAYEKAKEIDGKMMEAWKSLDGEKIVRREKELMKEYAGTDNLECVMCGKAPVAVVVEAAKLLGADSIELLKYANSGDVPAGDKREVVGYGAAVIYRKKKAGELSQEGQQYLLKVAREAITAAANGRKVPAFEAKTDELKAKRGVFVTLMKKGRLRGCIGCFSSQQELPATIAEHAVLSALRDNRFNPVKPNELDDISIKVSVLSERRKVDSADEVVVRKHGIWVVDPQTGRGGTYLPEVATDFNMSKDEFLSSCCREKAGLPADAWKKGKADIYIYTTQVFGEGK